MSFSPALKQRGLSYEGTLKATGYPTLNTAGMILEAVAYKKLGKPFLSEPIS